MTNAEKPIEVAVVGGGCAAVTAAFELTRPEHQGKYHVTLYQLGWRLGGKGASGRGAADRIEEHGLHLWLGFYENAFRLLRQCYAELDRDPETCRIADWRDAFYPDPNVGVAEQSRQGEWLHWLANFRPCEGTPGSPLTDENPFSVGSYLSRCADLLRTLLMAVELRGQGDRRHTDSREDSQAPFFPPASTPSPGSVADRMERLFKFGQLATVAALVEGARMLESLLKVLPGYPETIVLRLIETLASNARQQLDSLVAADDEVRRLWEMVDLLLAILRGSLRFGLLADPRGFDAVNDYDCREWLRLNGAAESSVKSAVVRGLYDLALAYEDGDAKRPALAAGQALRGSLRLFFTCRGSLFWKMRAGMGDVVFAPFYEVLKRRGVTFKFFHRLENVELAEPDTPGERPYVAALELDVQAEIEGGAEYKPLTDVRGLPCWPSEADFGQLVAGERLKLEGWDFESHWDRRKVRTKTLRVSEDFDFVVLGVSIGAIPYVCKEIVQRDRRWRAMVENVKTVATQAFQIWMRTDMEGLGWHDGQFNLSAFIKPFDTWADMRQLVREESWPRRPGSIAYFCSVLPTPPDIPARSETAYPAAERERVRRSAVRFLNHDVVHLWPRAVRKGGEFRWEVLVDPKELPSSEPAPGTAGESRFSSQFWTANVNPSDRYVLALPGTLKYRISPLDNTYDNLTITGDWTDCGFNEGCVEAAVMSGRLAAHAISQQPPLADIVGYDHP